jgi:hypothetical protein
MKINLTILFINLSRRRIFIVTAEFKVVKIGSRFGGKNIGVNHMRDDRRCSGNLVGIIAIIIIIIIFIIVVFVVVVVVCARSVELEIASACHEKLFATSETTSITLKIGIESDTKCRIAVGEHFGLEFGAPSSKRLCSDRRALGNKKQENCLDNSRVVIQKYNELFGCLFRSIGARNTQRHIDLETTDIKHTIEKKKKKFRQKK